MVYLVIDSSFNQPVLAYILRMLVISLYKTMPPITCITHQGPWNDSTREIPALYFIEQYSNKIDALEISGPFHNWYAPNSNFYDTDGTVYRGGENIWNWMKNLFKPFSALHHEVVLARVLNTNTTDEGISLDSASQWVVLETQTSFTMRNQSLTEEPIVIPRLLKFLVGKSEIIGQGTDGLQILEAKAWWDKSELGRQLRARKE